MRNTKASMAINQITGIILFVILIIASATLYGSSFDKVKKNSDKIDLKSYLGLESGDLMVDKGNIPQEFVDYAHKLASELFEIPDYTLPEGGLYFLTPYIEHLNKEDVYENYRIYLSYSDSSFNEGVRVSIFDAESQQYFPITSSQKNDALKGKKLCVLPGFKGSTSVEDTLVRTVDFQKLRIAIKRPYYSPQEIIEEGSTDQLSLFFGDADTTWFDGVADFPGMFLFSGNSQKLLYKYDKTRTNSKIPVYVYKDTVCFFDVNYKKIGNYFQTDKLDLGLLYRLNENNLRR